MSYDKKGKIPVYDAYPEDDREGEWKEYHTNDIADIKFTWGAGGFLVGGFVSGVAWLVYFTI